MTDTKAGTAAAPAFDYVLTFADYNVMSHYAQDRLSLWLSRWAFWPLVVVNTAAGLLLLQMAVPYGGFLGWLQFFGFGMAALMLIARFVAQPMMRKWHYNQTRLGGRDMRVTLGAEKVFISVKGMSSSIAVEEIEKAQEVPAHFFFWINPRQAIIIPKRAVTSEADAETIRAYVRNAGLEIT